MTITKQQLEELFILQVADVDELVKQRAEEIGPDEALEIFHSAIQAAGVRLEGMDKSKVNLLNRLSMAAKAAFLVGYHEALQCLAQVHADAFEAIKEGIQHSV